MDDNEFWNKVNLLIAIVLVTIVLAIMVETMQENSKIAELGKATSNPIAAYCAIHGINSYNVGVCGIQPPINKQQ